MAIWQNSTITFACLHKTVELSFKYCCKRFLAFLYIFLLIGLLCFYCLYQFSGRGTNKNQCPYINDTLSACQLSKIFRSYFLLKVFMYITLTSFILPSIVGVLVTLIDFFAVCICLSLQEKTLTHC